MKVCPKCRTRVSPSGGMYYCPECEDFISAEDVLIPKCPNCNNDVSFIIDKFYCEYCHTSIAKGEAIYTRNTDDDEYYDDDDEEEYEEEYSWEDKDDDKYDFEEPDYDSMIDNGDEICLNCTYWSVSPYGASHGMICRRNYPTSGPEDSCGDFVQSYHFASYGDNGQYQFNETKRSTKNKLGYWENSR